MRNILLITLSLFSIHLIGQKEYNYYSLHSSSEYSPIQYYPSKNVEKITFTTINIKNKKTKTYSKKYNQDGKLISFNVIDKSSEAQPINQIEYDKNGKQLINKSFKKGKLKNTITYTRTEKGSLLSQTKTNAKNKKVIFNTWKYNDDRNVSESIKHKKGSDKIDKRWTYEYYDKSNKSKSTLYNSKGKIINVWTFDCKQEGEKLEKKKNQTQVCKWEETSQEFLTKTYQSFDEKGDIVKYVTTYTLKDTLIVRRKIYDKNDLLSHESTYDKDFKKPLSFIYYRKGKKRSEWEYQYKDGLKIYESYSFKGKMKYKSEFSYNSNGLLNEHKSYNHKNDLTNSIKLDYTI